MGRLIRGLVRTYRRLAMLARGRRFDRDLEDEMRLHRELREQTLREAGATPSEASVAARRAFGNPLRLRERAREEWGWRPLDELGQDFRSGLRAMRRAPGFAAAAVVMLGAGIGASTAVFSIVRAVLIEPLAYAESRRLVVLNERIPLGDELSVSYPAFLSWRARQRSLSAVGLFQRLNVAVDEAGRPTPVQGALASSGIFTVLRWQVQLGRLLSDTDDHPGAASVVVLGDALWRRSYAADPKVIGRTVEVNGVPTRIVGVLAPTAAFPRGSELWLSIGNRLDDQAMERSNHPGWYVLGRLTDGTTMAQARDDFEAISRDLVRRFPLETAGATAEVRSLLERNLGQDRPRLAALAGLAALLLVAICANLAGLLLARGFARRGELAVRQVLGAGRGRIARQLLTESLVLAFGGGLVSLALAPLGVRLILQAMPLYYARLQAARLDSAGIAFALVLAVATAALFGAWPAWRLGRTGALRPSGGRAGSGPPDSGRMWWVLTSAQVALALTLLLTNFPLVRDVAGRRAAALGFDPSGILVAEIDSSLAETPGRPSLTDFSDRLLAEVRRLPDVFGATLNSSPPGRANWQSEFAVPGLAGRAGSRPTAMMSTVERGYFDVLRIPIRAGRTFTDAERRARAGVAVVDEALANAFWPDGGAIGGTVLVAGGPRTIVGIAASVRLQGLDPGPMRLQIYLPQGAPSPGNSSLLVRSAVSRAALAAQIGEIARGIDPGRLVFEPHSLEADLEDQLRLPQLVAGLGSALALFAVALAALGLHSLVVHTLQGRRFELGVRIAVGAAPWRIAWFALRRSAAAAAVGTGFGALCALLVRQALAADVDRVELASPAVLVLGQLLLYVLALSACLIPAARASRSQPARILRVE